MVSKTKATKPDKIEVGDRTVEQLNELGYDADGLRLDRPFDPKIEQQAEDLVAHYRMVVEWHEEDKHFYAGSPDYHPHMLCGHGRTEAAAIKMAREGLVAAVSTEIENGKVPPMPMPDKRDRQINVRVSGFEKEQLERMARQKGFRGIGDFVRHAALSQT
jgi:hypothetical protein